MTEDKIVRNWIERASYDLETAKSMLEAERYLYVGFFCQQAIEKLLKAKITQSGTEPPYIHNLIRLAEIAGIFNDLTEHQKDILGELTIHAVQSRYGDFEGDISEVLNPIEAEDLLQKTKELFEWLRAKLN
jgi:HEPN domain-containing protein